MGSFLFLKIAKLLFLLIKNAKNYIKCVTFAVKISSLLLTGKKACFVTEKIRGIIYEKAFNIDTYSNIGFIYLFLVRGFYT
jgi:hypothetical protein